MSKLHTNHNLNITYNYEKWSWKKWQDYETKSYATWSKNHEEKTAEFKKSIQIYNKNTKEIISLKHDPIAIQKDDYLWFFFNGKKLADEMEAAKDRTAIFVTMTLDSSHHEFSKKTKRYNPKFDPSNSIQSSAKILQKSYIRVAKDFRVQRKHIGIKSMRVIEPHANFTPHLHGVFFVETIYLEEFLNHLKNVSKDEGLGKQFDVEVLDNVGKSIGYLQKYIQKTAKPENEESFHIFNGWKKKNKIRMYAMSKGKLERYLFKKINTVCRFSENLEDENPISKALKECFIHVDTKLNDSGEVIEKEHNPFNNQRYIVKVSRTRYKLLVENELMPIDDDWKIKNGWDNSKVIFHNIGKFDPNRETKTLVFTRELEITYRYSIDEFTIYDSIKKKFLYRKSDYCLSTEEEIQEILYLQELEDQH